MVISSLVVCVVLFVSLGTGQGQANDWTCPQNYTLLTGLSGTLESPGYPSMYPANSDCKWRINVSVSQRVRIVFKAFEIEHQATCSYDYLQIRDRKLCSSRLPEPLTSEEDVFINFRTDNNLQKRGFALEWFVETVSTTGRVTTEKASTWHTRATWRPAIAATDGDLTRAGPAMTPWHTGATMRPDVGTTDGDPTRAGPAMTPWHTGVTMRPDDDTTNGEVVTPSSVSPTEILWHTGATRRPNVVITSTSWDNSTMDPEDYTDNLACYVCEGTSPECTKGEGLQDFVTECRAGEACWVERTGEGNSVSYRRSCQPSCPDYWQYETCMTANGQAQVCKLCCKENRCNTHVLTGHGGPGPWDTLKSGSEETVSFLGLVAVSALAASVDTFP